MNDVYCNNKFTYLKIDVDHKMAYNCHNAFPHPIDIDWLENNPGKIFHTDLMIKEREEMLAGIKNKSCYYQCYKAEDLGQLSERLKHQNNEYVEDVSHHPTTLDIALGTDCNLTCIYCQADFSSSWRRDLIDNGEYDIRNSDNWENFLKPRTRLLNNVTQKEKKQTRFFDVFLREIDLMKKTLKKVYLTGGEPLLNNYLIQILEICKDVPEIEIFSGLGVSESRFMSQVEKMKSFKNLKISISNESVGEYFEFNRFGSNWESFKKKIAILRENKINFKFHCTINNTVLINFNKFIDFCDQSDCEYTVTPIVYPDFLRPHVLDQRTKESIKIKLAKLSNNWKIKKLLEGMEKQPSETEKINCGTYLNEFTKRRNLDLKIFPESFLEWLKEKE